MKLARVADVVGIINGFAPFALAEEWDAVGLQVGTPTDPVERLMVALDPRPAAIEAAIAANCQLLVVHHPLLFKPLNKLVASDPLGALVMQAVRHGLSVVALHTNYDTVRAGLNDVLAERLGLTGVQILKVSQADELVKLAVFVPQEHLEPVMAALFRFSGAVGNYRDCSFRVAGTGTFTPQAGATPFIGTEGRCEEVAESRVEVLLRKADQAAVVKALLAAHPYEEPAFDLYPLYNRGLDQGLGRIGQLPAAVPLADFARQVGRQLQTPIRFCGDPQRPVRKIAVCSGSGASLLREAQFKGADVLVTGDVKHHDATDAELLGIALVDAGHYGTEIIMVGAVAEQLRTVLAQRGLAVEVLQHVGEQPLFQDAECV
jgi:dinuclear metal center YbgI/SA1388 family protein